MLQVDHENGATAAVNNRNVLSQTITVPAAGADQGFVGTQVYQYDPLNRIKQAAETIPNQAGWQQAFVYDRYGNRNFDEANTTTLLKNCMEGATPVVCAADVPVVNPSVDLTNNRLNGYGFDAQFPGPDQRSGTSGKFVDAVTRAYPSGVSAVAKVLDESSGSYRGRGTSQFPTSNLTPTIYAIPRKKN